MATATIRMSVATHDRLRFLAERRGVPVSAVIDQAARHLEDDDFWKEVNASYDRLNADPIASAAYDAEVRMLDAASLADFDESPYEGIEELLEAADDRRPATKGTHRMPEFSWRPTERDRFAAIRDDLARVSTASACQLLIKLGWRNAHMLGLRPIHPLGLGNRLVGRARTCRYLMRRAPEGDADPEARRRSAEIVLIEAIEPGDIFCVDALGVTTAGIIGDILSARLKARGAVAAMIHGAVRDAPYIKEVGLPVFAAATHPSHSGRDLVAVDYDQPIDMAGVQVLSGDILLADDEGIIAMPLDLAEYIAEHGPPKERLEEWIRAKIAAGGSVHDYYPPSAEKAEEYASETGRRGDG